MFLKQTKINVIIKFLFFLIIDIIIISISLYLSFLFRFDFNISNYIKLFILSLPIFIIIKILLLYIFKLYKIVWKYVGLKELLNTILANVFSEILLFFLIKHVFIYISYFKIFNGYPRSIFLMDLNISIILISGFRISKRLYLECLKFTLNQNNKNTLIIGAGNIGEIIVRDLKRNKFNNYNPCAFLDDDPLKINTSIHGVPVIGNIKEIKHVVKRFNINVIIIAITQIDFKKLKNIYHMAKDAGVEDIKIVPKIYAFTSPSIESIKLEDIKIEDLLKREEIVTNVRQIEKFLKGKKILVTGAAGSIGSELVKQISSFKPAEIVLFEIDETELYNLMLELKELYPDLFLNMKFVVGDITDRLKVNNIFAQYRPQIVFHAAAYKHVPMMEFNPEEAVKVNILGTYNVAESAIRFNSEKFIMISTDKAVRPTSIMGATKRMAEYICQSLNGDGTEFVSVRFGNVLGSRGSVLPIFLEQIKKGGPITVTHKDMKRYFMTVSEAVSLVLQASVMGKGGEVMVLDMGEPVKIVELAEELIRLHGLEPYKDIAIEFTGPRPGEKLFEELLTAEEGTKATYHERIFIAKNSIKYSRTEIEKILKEFKEILNLKKENDVNFRIRQLLKRYIRSYNPSNFYSPI